MANETAGDLLSDDGCPECDAPVVSVSSDSQVKNGDDFECAAGHTWTEGWQCMHCGDSEHDAMELPDEESFEDYTFEPEVEIDVTCESVYITPVDGGSGFAFNHDEFERIIEHFMESPYAQ